MLSPMHLSAEWNRHCGSYYDGAPLPYSTAQEIGGFCLSDIIDTPTFDPVARAYLHQGEPLKALIQPEYLEWSQMESSHSFSDKLLGHKPQHYHYHWAQRPGTDRHGDLENGKDCYPLTRYHQWPYEPGYIRFAVPPDIGLGMVSPMCGWG